MASNRTRRRRSRRNRQSFSDERTDFWSLLAMNRRRILPVLLAVSVFITIVIAVRVSRKPEEPSYNVPDVPFELNAYPAVNALMDTYYAATVTGNMAIINDITEGMTETDKLRTEEAAKYLDSIPVIDVYTKPGPLKDTYVAFVYNEKKLKGFDEPVPSMETWYVCTREDGSCYINEGETDQKVLDYIVEIALQDDVIDLSNKVTAQYNAMVESDPALSDFIVEYRRDLDEVTSELIAANATGQTSGTGADGTEASTDGAGSEMSTDESGDTAGTEGSEADAAASSDGGAGTGAATGSSQPVVLIAQEVVNIRSSDSENADRIGKTEVGEKFVLLEELANGWSRIDYDGKVAYVKSEYFKVQEESGAGVSTSASSDDSASAASSASAVTLSRGQHTVKETVRIRAAASTESEQIETAYEGDSIEVESVQADGWAKVKYKGKSGYCKAEFLE